MYRLIEITYSTIHISTFYFHNKLCLKYSLFEWKNWKCIKSKFVKFEQFCLVVDIFQRQWQNYSYNSLDSIIRFYIQVLRDRGGYNNYSETYRYETTFESFIDYNSLQENAVSFYCFSWEKSFSILCNSKHQGQKQ